jgi:EAL domain-containing protein (putative c-di-GMP-specific phosphodiesterase class I)
VLLARELQLAIARDELELLYQPQVHITSGRIVGLDTHLRWNHPARGVIEPAVFIPIAERSGTIIAVGEWMLDEACRQLHQWERHGLAPPILAIDIAAGQLKAAPNILADVKNCLDKHGVAPGSIELECSEPVLMLAAQRYAATLDALRDLGFRMSIRDFGNGYSSIGYLASAPVQRLKMPRALVVGALGSDACARAIRAIVQVGRELETDVIADGVETQAQAMFVLAAGCEQAQGPFFAPIVTAHQATVLLRHANVASPVSGRASGTSAA